MERAAVRDGTAAAESATAEILERRVVGCSAAMRRVRERILALSPLSVPVLVQGESGTGRDCVVRALHAIGEYRESSLSSLRCGRDSSSGLPVAGSVIYLDEVGRLPLRAQAEWLGHLRERQTGASRPMLRLFASTSEDLRGRVRRGTFIAELADLLSRFAIHLPPLRERRRDIPLLVSALLARIGNSLGRENCSVRPSALGLLERQNWPGNVRELAGVLEKLVAFSARGEITGDQVGQVLGEQLESVDFFRARRDVERREQLVVLLEECGGNLSEVARRLNMSRSAITSRAQKYGLLRKGA